ncbi:MAG: tRNA (adenosine(37)-N6)-dimethylallyltransferase MiaA [Bacteroidales bacterium]
MHKLIVILGPTATGKTNIATSLAYKMDGEIISADSRQVYKGMDLGTGKDLNEYTVAEKKIPYHLIDIKKPGYEYNVFEFQNDFLTAFNEIDSKEKQAILCGGTGLYIESVLKGYKLLNVPDNIQLRENLETMDDEQLIKLLKSMRRLHNTSDVTERKRLIRAIEIETYYKEHPKEGEFPKIPHIIFGVKLDRKIIREKISKRLAQRIEEGMIKEVEDLIKNGVKPEELKFYGLEYKFVTQFICGEISKEELYRQLNTAIHQFAKRQSTWFRRMEKNGFKIHWIDGLLNTEEKVNAIINIYNEENR